jgi:hypothetical protein
MNPKYKALPATTAISERQKFAFIPGGLYHRGGRGERFRTISGWL